MIMLKDETKFDQLGQKLFMKGVLIFIIILSA